MAFMLEAGFLGIMVFGWNRVSPGIHFFATCIVAFAASLSAFWIMSANAWMQTSVFVIGGISAWYILRRVHVKFFLRSFKLAVLAAVVITPLQVIIGDGSGLLVYEHQPAKLVAIEGHWETNAPGEGADWVVLA